MCMFVFPNNFKRGEGIYSPGSEQGSSEQTVQILLSSIPREGTDFLFFIVFRPRESEDGREGGERKEKEDHLIAVSAFKNSPASHPENNGR